jgi:hypothetical protein
MALMRRIFQELDMSRTAVDSGKQTNLVTSRIDRTVVATNPELSALARLASRDPEALCPRTVACPISPRADRRSYRSGCLG